MTTNMTPPDIKNYPPEPQSKAGKRINKVILGALLVIAVSILVMLSWAASSDKVIDLKQNPFPTRTIREHPTAGGVVFLTTNYCKLKNTEGEMRVSYVSETREVFLPLSRERSPKGCRNVELPILIPKDITPDTYRVKLRLTYNINPLKQNITQEFYSQEVIIDSVTPTNGLPADANLQPRN